MIYDYRVREHLITHPDGETLTTYALEVRYAAGLLVGEYVPTAVVPANEITEIARSCRQFRLPPKSALRVLLDFFGKEAGFVFHEASLPTT